MKKYDVITIGGIVEDTTFFVDQGKLIKDKKKKVQLAFELGTKVDIKSTHISLGGGACNTATGFNKLGLRTAPLVRIGDDIRGKMMLKKLKKMKIDTSLVQIDQDNATGFSFICGFGKNKHHVVFSHRGAAKHLEFDKNSMDEIEARWLHVTSLKNKNWMKILDNVVEHAKDNKVRWSWNPGGTQLMAGKSKLSKYLKVVDVLLVNRSEAESLTRHKERNISKLLKKISSFGPRIVVITDGAGGAYVYNNDWKKEYYHKALAKKVMDTTGAGDSFASGFISGILMYDDARKALKLANSQAVLREVGAQNGLLTKKDLIKIFK